MKSLNSLKPVEVFGISWPPKRIVSQTNHNRISFLFYSHMLVFNYTTTTTLVFYTSSYDDVCPKCTSGHTPPYRFVHGEYICHPMVLMTFEITGMLLNFNDITSFSNLGFAGQSLFSVLFVKIVLNSQLCCSGRISLRSRQKLWGYWI